MDTPRQPAALVAWSSGKDSTWTLYRLQQTRTVQVVGLLTTVSRDTGRVPMHHVREELLDAQAAAVGLPLYKVPIPTPCSNQQYEEAMAAALAHAVSAGITAIAFGDLFLEDVRSYRERSLAETGITPIFPLWGTPTAALAQEMVTAGLRAYLTSIDPARLAPSFIGRVFDAQFLADLPQGVDPCGEWGEFHTFVYQAPIFARPLPLIPGEVLSHNGFLHLDLALDAGQEHV
ncbi:MAG: ATP-binding protein [Candidatus Binatia bacterium]